ncbi:hypothetical protein, partial [Streptomyces apricus]|uniref:hypothetical protein n=1 Tax=Streptomyces apricus TaxID=1828112 RepID=UPI00165ED19F
GGGGGAAHDPERTAERARRVADAWEGSEAARIWRAGYFPLGAAVQLPEGAFRSEADKRAYAGRNFELRTPLPGDAQGKGPRKDAQGKGPGKGEVRWRDGDPLTVAVSTARASYGKLARGGSAGHSLVVTGARLAGMTVPTGRGPATVPAWHFDIEGYDTPLKRVAVEPSKPPRPPIGPDRRTPDAPHPLFGLGGVSRDGRGVTVWARHGSCDEGPAVDVLETGDSVVLSPWVRGRSDGLCTADLRIEEVTVRLDRPVGDRLLLDASTGRPVLLADRTG